MVLYNILATVFLVSFVTLFVAWWFFIFFHGVRPADFYDPTSPRHRKARRLVRALVVVAVLGVVLVVTA
jgi:heme/copper-type cytochrome/quinol oxidase subunit 2